MTNEAKTNVKNSVGRLVFVALVLLAQILWLLYLALKLTEYSTYISVASSILALIIVLYIYGRYENAAFKMPWIMLILALPVFGLCIYFLFGRTNATKKISERYRQIDEVLIPQLRQEETVIEELGREAFPIASHARYIRDCGSFPVYKNTKVEFFSEAKDGFEAQLRDLEQAKRFIFLEYHAIQEAEAFARLKEILARKAKEGVEIRLFYDDVGSIGFLDSGFIKRMEEIGVQCRVFNAVIPFLNIFMNNRDHRKITVIDGTVGYTGGYNLADEYFNITHPYGYWKDTGVRLEGEAVRSLTVMFLEMWNVMDKNAGTDLKRVAEAEAERYLKGQSKGSGSTRSDILDEAAEKDPVEAGYVQPYADSPLDKEPVGENVYLNLIASAKEYLYVATPYLIISDELTRALGLAAKRGVDVRIITPGIPDKKVVYQLTRSYYNGLARQGVGIYEYTPGFIHAKQMVCDGMAATVGTINLDFRSLYHHFENGVMLYRGDVIADIKKDFDEMFPICREVTEKYASGRSSALRITQCVLRLFAPLM